MGQAMRRLGQTLRAAETKGATSYEVGTTVGAPVDQWVQVDIAGKVWPVYVPGSFRAALADGQSVRVSLSVDGVRTIDSVLSTLPTPILDDAGDEADTWDTTASGPLGFGAAGYSNAGFTSQDFQVAFYAEYLAGFGRGAASDMNSMKGTVNNLVEFRNEDRALLLQIRDLLISQGLGEGL